MPCKFWSSPSTWYPPRPPAPGRRSAHRHHRACSRRHARRAESLLALALLAPPRPHAHPLRKVVQVREPRAGPTGGVTNGAAPKCGQATRAILKMSCPVLGFSRRDRIGGGGISAILRTLMLSSTSVVGRGAEASWRERPERARRERASWSERHKARGFIHSRRASTRTKRSSDPLAESRN